MIGNKKKRPFMFRRYMHEVLDRRDWFFNNVFKATVVIVAMADTIVHYNWSKKTQQWRVLDATLSGLEDEEYLRHSIDELIKIERSN